MQAAAPLTNLVRLVVALVPMLSLALVLALVLLVLALAVLVWHHRQTRRGRRT